MGEINKAGWCGFKTMDMIQDWMLYSVPHYLRKFYILNAVKPGDIVVDASCFTGDTLIPLLDGYSVPIKELVSREEFFVYSYDLGKNKVVVGRAHSCRKTREVSKILGIKLDNGGLVRCTTDHRFMLRNGTYKQARFLQPGDSLMPLYRKLSTRPPSFIEGYEEVLQPSGDYEFTHGLADNFNLEHRFDEVKNGSHRHHRDFNRLNNNPSNIRRMTKKKHFELHSKVAVENMKRNLKNPEFLKQLSDRMVSRMRDPELKAMHLKGLAKFWYIRWEDPVYRAHMLAILTERNQSEEQRYAAAENLKKLWQLRRVEMLKGNFNRKGKKNSNMGWSRGLAGTDDPRILNLSAGIRKAVVDGRLKRDPKTGRYCKNVNHKVVGIRLSGIETVYNFEVDEYHNFAIDVDKGNSQSSGIFVHNCGYGETGLVLYRNRTGIGKYTGFDIDPAKIEDARTKISNKRFDYIVKDLKEPFAYTSEVIDVVISEETIEHVSKVDAVLFMTECHRILKVGGTFLLSTPNRYQGVVERLEYGHLYEWDYNELLTFVKNLGFKIVKQFGLGFNERINTLPDKLYEGNILYKKMREFLPSQFVKTCSGLPYPDKAGTVYLHLEKM